MTCEEFEELSGAYALEAVTPAERDAAQAHLSSCAACTHRWQGLRAVVNLLPYSVQQVNPAKSLKGRLFAAIRMESSPNSTCSDKQKCSHQTPLDKQAMQVAQFAISHKLFRMFFHHARKTSE